MPLRNSARDNFDVHFVLLWHANLSWHIFLAHQKTADARYAGSPVVDSAALPNNPD
jgi:hypothetical protein